MCVCLLGGSEGRGLRGCVCIVLGMAASVGVGIAGVGLCLCKRFRYVCVCACVLVCMCVRVGLWVSARVSRICQACCGTKRRLWKRRRGQANGYLV